MTDPHTTDPDPYPYVRRAYASYGTMLCRCCIVAASYMQHLKAAFMHPCATRAPPTRGHTMAVAVPSFLPVNENIADDRIERVVPSERSHDDCQKILLIVIIGAQSRADVKFEKDVVLMILNTIWRIIWSSERLHFDAVHSMPYLTKDEELHDTPKAGTRRRPV